MHVTYLLFLSKRINFEFKILKIILPCSISIVMWIWRQRIGYAGDTRWSEYTCDVKDIDIQLQEIIWMMTALLGSPFLRTTHSCRIQLVRVYNKDCKKYPKSSDRSCPWVGRQSALASLDITHKGCSNTSTESGGMTDNFSLHFLKKCPSSSQDFCRILSDQISNPRLFLLNPIFFIESLQVWDYFQVNVRINLQVILSSPKMFQICCSLQNSDAPNLISL